MLILVVEGLISGLGIGYRSPILLIVSRSHSLILETVIKGFFLCQNNNMDPQIRRELRRQENESRRSAPVNGPATIGARSDTGNYDITFVDGSVYPGKGVKVFNTAHSEGDTVVAIPRQDGNIALEGPKARPNAPNILDDPCGNYLEGQIFSCPQPEPDVKGRVHVLFFSAGRLWVGGHKNNPEPVGPIGLNLSNARIWADRVGWVVSGRTGGTIPRLEITRSGVASGVGLLFPAPAPGYFSGIGEDLLGFGRIFYLGNLYANNQWYPTIGTETPIAAFGEQIIYRTTSITADGIHYFPERHDRSSSISLVINNRTGLPESGFRALTSFASPGDPAIPDLIFNEYDDGGIPYVNLPTGTYTDRIFTRIATASQVNDLKTRSGLVSITTQSIGGVRQNASVKAYKIPGDAFIVQYVVTA